MGIQIWVVFPSIEKGLNQVRHLNTFNGLEAKVRHYCVILASL